MGHAHSIRENPGQIAGIAAISAAIGAVTAMLVTPRTGSQTRNGIKRRAISGKDTLMDKIHTSTDDAAETLDKTKEKAKDKTAELADKAKDKTDS